MQDKCHTINGEYVEIIQFSIVILMMKETCQFVYDMFLLTVESDIVTKLHKLSLANTKEVRNQLRLR